MNNGLGNYIKSYFDIDKNGKVTWAELKNKIVHNPVVLLIVFVNVLVMVGEYRVFDAGMQMTGGDVLKAIGFVLVSFVPFELGQIAWLYPLATDWQKRIAASFIIGGMGSSAMFGRADLFFTVATVTVDAEWLIQAMIVLTLFYVGASLVYIVIDPNIKAWRVMVQNKARVKQIKNAHTTAQEILKMYEENQAAENKLKSTFGADGVKRIMDELVGAKRDAVNYASDLQGLNPTSADED